MSEICGFGDDKLPLEPMPYIPEPSENLIMVDGQLMLKIPPEVYKPIEAAAEARKAVAEALRTTHAESGLTYDAYRERVRELNRRPRLFNPLGDCAVRLLGVLRAEGRKACKWRRRMDWRAKGPMRTTQIMRAERMLTRYWLRIWENAT